MPKYFQYAYRKKIEIPRTTAYKESLKPYSRNLNGKLVSENKTEKQVQVSL
jgi:hypothetical protein